MTIEQGSLSHTVLVYTISEPGDWTTDDIADDLPGASPEEIRSTVNTLFREGFIHINSSDKRLWPKREGRAALRA